MQKLVWICQQLKNDKKNRKPEFGIKYQSGQSPKKKIACDIWYESINNLGDHNTFSLTDNR